MFAPHGVLALDLSSSIGWAYGHSPRELDHGTWLLPHQGGEGARGAAFQAKLCELMERTVPRTMVIEAPLPPVAQTNSRSARQQYGLNWQAHAEAWCSSCPVVEIDSYSARLEVMGGKRLSKDLIKREVLRFVHAQGIKCSTHHAADAALVWLWHYQRAGGGFVPKLRAVAA